MVLLRLLQFSIPAFDYTFMSRSAYFYIAPFFGSHPNFPFIIKANCSFASTLESRNLNYFLGFLGVICLVRAYLSFE